MNVNLRERLDDARELTERTAVTGVAVGQRLAAAGASAGERARKHGRSLPAHVRRVDAKRTANTAIWGLQAGSKVPGGPYSTALGTGLGAAYGAYQSASEGLETDERTVEISATAENHAAESEPRTASAGGRSGPRISPGQVSAMALSGYDWYKRGKNHWGLKGGVAGATFGLARGFYGEPTDGDGSQ